MENKKKETKKHTLQKNKQTNKQTKKKPKPKTQTHTEYRKKILWRKFQNPIKQTELRSVSHTCLNLTTNFSG